MAGIHHCPKCGAHIKPNTRFCSRCHIALNFDTKDAVRNPISDKSVSLTFFLCLFFGVFGAHRFYTGRYLSGFFMLLTLGGCFTWVLIDLLLISSGHFLDGRNKHITLIHPDDIKPMSTALSSIISFLAIVGISLTFMAITIVVNLTKQLYTIHQELVALRNNQLEVAMTYTSPDFQKNITIADFKDFVDQNPILTDATFHLDIADYYDRAIGIIFPSTFLVKGTLISQGELSSPIYFLLVKDGFSWRINRIDTALQGIQNKEQQSGNPAPSNPNTNTTPFPSPTTAPSSIQSESLSVNPGG